MESITVDDVLQRYPGAVPLSRGGQRVVFSALHPTHGKVVIKVGRYASPSTLERIRREVKTLQSLNSSYFPSCYEFELLDANRFLIIEERADGQPLQGRIAEFSGGADATRMLSHLVQGLSLLWQANIVHRDVKPANIIVRQDGFPRIIDLGIARLLDEDSLTHTFAPFGPCTPAYASPEQLENRKHEINHRSDQFSLGIVFGQLLLAGKHPFDPSLVGGGSIPENILAARWAKGEITVRNHSTVLPLLAKLLAPPGAGAHRGFVQRLLSRPDVVARPSVVAASAFRARLVRARKKAFVRRARLRALDRCSCVRAFGLYGAGHPRTKNKKTKEEL